MTGFETGTILAKKEVHSIGAIHGAFHLWLVDKIAGVDGLYVQMRASDKSVAPGRLDASAGGHYLPGESPTDGLRELEEELGVTIRAEDLRFLGKRYSYYVASNINNVEIIDVFIAQTNFSLQDFKLDAREVTGVYFIPLQAMMDIFVSDVAVACAGITVGPAGVAVPHTLSVCQETFSPSIDRYAYKVAIQATYFLNGGGNLVM